jgi:exodeoxyribonuclease VIII
MRAEGKHILSNEDYHSDKHYFSSSQLKHALQSASHFRYEVLDKKGKKKKTKAFDLGSLVHTVLLEPHLFDDEYIVYDGPTNADGSVPKAAADRYANSHPGLTPVSVEQNNFAMMARANVEKYPFAKELFYSEGCEYESSFFYKDKETGLRLRFRPDILNLDKKYIVDLKTAVEVDMYQFKKAVCYTWDYDLSAYMYIRGVYEMFGVLCDYYWAVIGKDPTAPIAIYKMSATIRDDGKLKFYKACDNINNALTLGEEIRYQMEPQEL